MQTAISRALIISTVLLLVPYIASLFVEGWNWSGFDYVFAWVMFSFLSLALTYVVRIDTSISYKAAVGLSAVTTFVLVWINGAVGIIGDSDINMLYAFVALIVVVGAAVAKLRAGGMAVTLFIAAAAQFLIPIVALIAGVSDFSPGVPQVLLLNACWVISFATAGALFRSAR